MHKRAISALVLFLPILAHAAGITDYSSHKAPYISFPSAGNSYTDPVFGTKIIRVTDSRYGARCYHAYSYWAAFNYNNTRLLMACDKKPMLFKFDPTYDKLTYDGLLGGDWTLPKIAWQGAVWSDYSTDSLYALESYGRKLYKVNVTLRTSLSGFKVLYDFTSKFGTGVYLNQMTMSTSGDVFSFHTVSTSTYKPVDAVVYVRSTGKIYVMPRVSGEELDETKIDKDGQYMIANFKSDNAAIYNFSAGTVKMLYKSSSSANVSGHFDLGSTWTANSDGWHTGLVVRDLSSPFTTYNIVKYKKPDGSLNWSICDHVSVREKHETFIVGSTYCGSGNWYAFEREIYLAFTDGHGFVRLAHHYSAIQESDSEGKYWAQPRASASRDGHYIVYTSDLGSSTRTDVMILKVPSNYWPY